MSVFDERIPDFLPDEESGIEKAGGVHNYYQELLANRSADEVADFLWRSGMEEEL